MVEIPLDFKLQESNSRITKIRRHLMPPPPQTPSDKIQTFNRLGVNIESIFQNIWRGGRGQGCPLNSYYTRKKTPPGPYNRL